MGLLKITNSNEVLSLLIYISVDHYNCHLNTVIWITWSIHILIHQKKKNYFRNVTSSE